jgi:hypothetical protein
MQVDFFDAGPFAIWVLLFAVMLISPLPFQTGKEENAVATSGILRAVNVGGIEEHPRLGLKTQDQGGAKVDSAGAVLGEDALPLPLLPSICLPSSHLPSNCLASLLSLPPSFCC